MSGVTTSEAEVADITALLQQSRLPEATERARQALDRGIESPLLLNLRAYWLEREGRDTDALADLERARILAPDDAAVRNALGLCFARLGRMDEALAAFAAAAALAPGFAPAHFNCGWAAEELGELDQAERHFAAAARLDPRSADPSARLAALAARRGRWSIARQHAEAALVCNPGHAAAATLALASADLAEQATAAAETRLRGLLASPALADRDRATALGLLGDILDAEKRYDAAFESYAAGNALFQKAFAGRVAAAAEMSMSDYVAWLQAYCESPGLAPWALADTAASFRGPERHIFLLGFPRSGTTLLEETLACHPNVVTTGEKDALAETVRTLMAGPSDMERLKTLGEAALDRHRLAYWEALGKLGVRAEGKILVDKQPFNTVRLPLIAKLFPEAKIVFCLRDPRDVVLSCFRRRFTMTAANYEFLTLEGAAKLYDAVMRLARLYRAQLPVALHEIRTEALVDNFEEQMRALCAFVGLPWIAEFREFAERSAAREVATPSSTQILRGLNREGIGHWRNYAQALAGVTPLLTPWVKHFNYPAD